MNLLKSTGIVLTVLLLGLSSCKKDDDGEANDPNNPSGEVQQSAVQATFNGAIDLENLLNYSSQPVPNYINKDNTAGNFITDAGATLGRVLFYDVNLSVDNSISCSSCHQQQHAFSDFAQASIGVDGTTGRHSMRLINARFADEVQFFWDERAGTLEEQTTMPIQDHIEMGWSGENGDPGFDDLIVKLEDIDYYNELFAFVYGDAAVTEERIQDALAQFIRSIQSFDSKFDEGMETAPNPNAPFLNFTAQENEGKNLFIAPPQFDGNSERIGGGLGCQGCHRAPEFDIDPLSLNNGVIGTLDGGQDLTVTRSPSLRDILKADGTPNGGFMHTGGLAGLTQVINHYDQIQPNQVNDDIDPRLTPGGIPQNLNMTADERQALIAFLQTLTGENVYTDVKWSDPF